MSKEKIKVGNFLISKEGNEIERIKIESVSGNWNMKIPSFNPHFNVIRELANNKDTHKYLEALIQVCYITCNTVLDVQFMQDFYDSYNKLIERQKSFAEQNDNDEEELQLAKEIYESQKESEEASE